MLKRQGMNHREMLLPLSMLLITVVRGQGFSQANVGGSVYREPDELRNLESDIFQRKWQGPSRQCGQVIGITSRDDIVNMASAFTDMLLPINASDPSTTTFNSLSKQFIASSYVYDVHATVICASCEEIMQLYNDSSFVNGEEKNGFLSYCGPDRYGYNVTHSGLILAPIDPETNEVFQGRLKGLIFTHDILVDPRQAPSENWPVDLNSHFANISNLAEFRYRMASFGEGIGITTTGLMTIVPDYIGFGQSHDSPRSFGVKALYQQAASTLWLKAQHMFSNTTGSCTILENNVSFSGYSEGGYAAFAAALALDRLGAEILNVRASAAPFRLARQLQWIVDRYDLGVADPALRVILTLLANAYSSTNPDLANSGTGQNLLADAWMDSNNYTQNVRSWVGDDLSENELVALLPTPYAPGILRSDFVKVMQEATNKTSVNPCSFASGTTVNKLCEALADNNLYPELLSTTFPVVICHSPDDEVVSTSNIPEVELNDKLSLFSFYSFMAGGTHDNTADLHMFGAVASFSVANPGAVYFTGVQPLDSSCIVAPPPPAPSSDSSSPDVAASSGTSRGGVSWIHTIGLILISVMYSEYL